ncbi:MAG: zf-TFIIB domain-containing protein [Vulcanimicrobiota bacterium]
MSMIRCPACNELMRKINLPGVELDECRFCDGLWLDRDEPEAVSFLDIVGKHLLLPVSFDDSRRSVPEGRRLCPRCDRALAIIEHRNLNVEICPECRGMFCDRFEIQKLMED